MDPTKKNYDVLSLMQIKFKGKGHCKWTTTTGSGENRTTEEHSSKEKYFREKVVVWTSDDAPNQMLPSGAHSFPFQFTFPTDKVIPSSFDRSLESDLGSIRYKIKAGISNGDKYVHVAKARLPFREAVSVASLNSSVEREDEKTVGCLCCASGPVVVKVDLPRTGFRVGESVPVVINVENNSTRDVTMSASIVEKITYIAEGMSHKYHTRSIASVGLNEPVRPRATEAWNTEQLAIPPATVPSQSSSDVIKVAYAFVASGSIPWSLGSRQEITIVIGTV